MVIISANTTNELQNGTDCPNRDPLNSQIRCRAYDRNDDHLNYAFTTSEHILFLFLLPFATDQSALFCRIIDLTFCHAFLSAITGQIILLATSPNVRPHTHSSFCIFFHHNFSFSSAFKGLPGKHHWDFRVLVIVISKERTLNSVHLTVTFPPTRHLRFISDIKSTASGLAQISSSLTKLVHTTSHTLASTCLLPAFCHGHFTFFAFVSAFFARFNTCFNLHNNSFSP